MYIKQTLHALISVIYSEDFWLLNVLKNKNDHV